jgi:heme exporter protein C
MATLQTGQDQNTNLDKNNRNTGAPRPSTPAPPRPLQGAWWKWGVGLLMSYVIYGAFFIAKGAVGFGQSGNPARIVFFHVPCAILASVCYFVGMIYAVLYLTGRTRAALDADAKSATSMELGFLFCILATVTGSIFAGVQWGSFWNWDPRETSIVIMLLLYASYLILRGALVEQPDKRARLCAVYAIIALIPAQFLIWVVPRLPGLGSLHPPDTLVNPDKTSWTYKGVLYPSFLAFTLLYVWLFQLRMRMHDVVARRRRQREF